MIVPLIAPTIRPRTRPMMIATIIGIPKRSIHTTTRHPEQAIIAPAIRSIPPNMMVSITPSARKPVVEIVLRIVSQLFNVIKLSVAIVSTTHSAIKAPRIPRFAFRYLAIGPKTL